jgi:protein-L-isoaspartate(D-aspartate) O-methyltransferase
MNNPESARGGTGHGPVSGDLAGVGAVDGWRDRAAGLVDELAARGVLSSPVWRRAVAEVPRHRLVPVYYRYASGGWRAEDTTSPEGRERWLQLVYSNAALFVLPGGMSSTSMPGLMTSMLETLNIGDGHRVLEVGTGAGYNAALLCHRLGDGQVYSVDLEPELVALAGQRLAELGYRPTLAARDGAEGLPEHAPYDRIVATCSVPAIPWAWVEQTQVGGLILADLRPLRHAGNLVLLHRRSDRAQGRFSARHGTFMPMRHTIGAPAPHGRGPARDRAEADTRMTGVDLPRPWENQVFAFFAEITAGLNITSYGQTMNPDTGRPGDAFVSSADGSWCEISEQPNSTGDRTVWQAGARRLWDLLDTAYQRWERLGCPRWQRFGLTVTEHGHTVWLDDPAGEHRWNLTTPAPS